MSKRSYTNFLDKDEFPFIIENNKIIYPKLLSKLNNSNKIRFWKIYAYLIDLSNKEIINLTNNLIDINNFKSTKNKNVYYYRIWTN